MMSSSGIPVFSSIPVAQIKAIVFGTAAKKWPEYNQVEISLNTLTSDEYANRRWRGVTNLTENNDKKSSELYLVTIVYF